jgi:hypothetical protein
MEIKLRKKFTAVVYDLAEGRVPVTVMAFDADDAEEEARIAASEAGCSMIDDVEVMVDEEDAT